MYTQISLIPAVAMVLLATNSEARSQAAPVDQTILQEGATKVSYRFDGENMIFSSALPSGWSFAIAVDGDQNGVWGIGKGMDFHGAERSADFKIGQDSHGALCGQYILTSAEADPGEVLVSTDCATLVTGGSVRLGQIKPDDSVEINYQIPTATMFGRNDTLRLQLCIWNTIETKCHFSPKAPFVIQRPVRPDP